jgi:uncharacterized repeat protein (TIGR02543 family)
MSSDGGATWSDAQPAAVVSAAWQCCVSSGDGSRFMVGAYQGRLYTGISVDRYRIAASATVGGSISPFGSIAVEDGCSQNFAITPNAGYHIMDVLVDGSSVGAVTSYEFTNVATDHTITATFAIDTHTIYVNETGAGSVAISPGQGTYDHGTPVTLTATPASGSHFVGWSGDLTGTTNPATIIMDADKTITATFASAGPTAIPQSVDVTEDDSVGITLGAADPDVGDTIFAYIITSGPLYGTLTGGTGPGRMYTPAPDFSTGHSNGSDSLTFTATDANGNVSAPAVVTITVHTVNDPPVITEGVSTPVIVDEDGNPTPWNLTLNATDADGDTLTWSILTQALHSIATASGNGTSKVIGYVPTPNWNGTDSFVVQVRDGYGGTDDITVNVTVSPRNDFPVNTVLPLISGNPHPGQTLSTTSGTWDDSLDSLSTVLTYGFRWQSSTDGGITWSAVFDAISQSYLVVPSDIGKVLRCAITCRDESSGVLPVQYVGTLSNSVAVTNAAPVITEGASMPVTMDEDGSPLAWKLTLHATDADVIDTLTWSIVTVPAHGTLTLPANPTGLSVSPVYHPALNWNGTDTFILRVDDGLTGTADITVTVTVNPINDAPVCMGLPSVSGTGVAGHQLTADPGSWDDHLDQAPGHVGISVQWLRFTTASGADAQPVAGASGMTYDVRAGDVGFFLGVQVTATDDGEGLPASMQTSAISNFIRAVAKDTTPPVVQFVHPLPKQVTTSRLSIDVTAADIQSGMRSLTVNGTQVYPCTNGIFHCDLSLVKGDNAFVIVAVDNAGNQWSQTYHVTYVPLAPRAFTHTITLVIDSKTMTVDGAKTSLDAPAIIREGRTLVPLRVLVESLGGTISWNARTRQVTVKARGVTIILTVGKNTATVNGKSLRIDPKNAKVVPVLSSSRTLLPLRFVAEQLGFEVGWNETTRTITLSCED